MPRATVSEALGGRAQAAAFSLLYLGHRGWEDIRPKEHREASRGEAENGSFPPSHGAKSPGAFKNIPRPRLHPRPGRSDFWVGGGAKRPDIRIP